LLRTTGAAFLADPRLSEEIFGPATLLVACKDADQMEAVAKNFSGNLTATIHATDADGRVGGLLEILEQKAGRVIVNGFPTGVEVVPSQQHGGPYPAASRRARSWRLPRISSAWPLPYSSPFVR
jgi:NADP-dependent aldehyde dehydrogenase